MQGVAQHSQDRSQDSAGLLLSLPEKEAEPRGSCRARVLLSPALLSPSPSLPLLLLDSVELPPTQGHTLSGQRHPPSRRPPAQSERHRALRCPHVAISHVGLPVKHGIPRSLPPGPRRHPSPTEHLLCFIALVSFIFMTPLLCARCWQ